MNKLTLHKQKARLTCELTAWQAVAIGLLAASALVNGVFASALMDARARLASEEAAHQAQLQQAEHTRDLAVRQLGEMALQAERDKQAAAEQTAAYEALEGYRYIGECVITAYCPCEACCGQWADGLTATGIPAGPGIAAVDPDVIPLGSTVIIDGQRYLAADTGVTGLHVDVCVSSHREADNFGVKTKEVWVDGKEQQ